jgi:hypothetical protein
MVRSCHVSMGGEHMNADIDTQPLIDDQWFKVTKQVMSNCCQ